MRGRPRRRFCGTVGSGALSAGGAGADAAGVDDVDWRLASTSDFRGRPRRRGVAFGSGSDFRRLVPLFVPGVSMVIAGDGG